MDDGGTDRMRSVAGLVAVLGLAGALRFAGLRGVAADPFYDASVRTMAGSWHALVVGALEPGARVAIDKPPLDLWLQAATVRLLGFGRLQLQLPVALAGLAAVALLFDLVRRLAGTAAGLTAAAALAVLPLSVLTARSDTMDTVMMALLVLAAWLATRAAQTRRPWLLWLAGGAAGLAFEVKLLEAVVALPALALGTALAWPGARRHLAGAAAAFCAVALAWLVALSLLPAGERPFALGSENGSAWSAAFVYDGIGRLGIGVPAPDAPTVRIAPAMGGTGPLRLLRERPSDAAGLIGTVTLAAMALGLGAALLTRGRPAPRRAASLAGALRARLPADRVRAAALVGLVVWLTTGLVVYSGMARLHLRYLEGFTPAVAATLGVGLVALARAAPRRRTAAAGCVAATALAAGYAVAVAEPPPAARAVALAATAAVACLAAVAVGRRDARAWPLLATVALVAVLAAPTARSVEVVRTSANDSGAPGALPPHVLARLSAYLIAHQGDARDEAAVQNPYTAAAIVVRDQRPIMILDNTDERPLVPVAELRAAVRRGDVRSVLVGPECLIPSPQRPTAGCADARWVQAHGTEVTAQAGIWRGRRHSRLFRVSDGSG